MMKKLCLMMCLIYGLSSFSVYAADVTLTQNTKTQEIKIDAKAASPGYASLQIRKCTDDTAVDITPDNAEKILMYVSQKNVGDDGLVNFDFKFLEKTGKYKTHVCFSDGTVWEKEFNFVNSIDMENAYKSIKKEIENVIKTGQSLNVLIKLTEENFDKLGIDGVLYNSLKATNNNMEDIYKWIISQPMVENPSDFCKLFDEGTVIYGLNKAKTISDIENIVLEFINFTESEGKTFKQTLTPECRVNVYEKLLISPDFTSLLDIKTDIRKFSLMQAFEDLHWSILTEVFEDNKTIISNDIWNAYNGLKYFQKPKFIKDLSGNPYSDFSVFMNACKEMVKKLNEEQSGSTGGSGSGGGSGGGGGINKPSLNPPSKTLEIDNSLISGPDKLEIEESTNYKFVDLEGFEWAKSAIITLAQKNIVMGKTENAFAPEDFITREEFLTLLMRGFNISDKTAENTFKDVEKGSWYYEAIATAQKLGITNGVNASDFGVGQTITREELCAFSYKVAKCAGVKFDATNKENPFKDEISEYALPYVIELANNG
ncbi:MAG: S-layer homology domain-containing protein, partial [Oscillospiraceae bacterium]